MENKIFTLQDLAESTKNFFKQMEKLYKFTPEYVKNNKVAIEVNSKEDIDGLKLLNCHGYLTSTAHEYRKFLTIPKEGTWALDEILATENGYEIIKASDFIKNNTKQNTMENKKIVGYKLINKGYASAIISLCGLPPDINVSKISSNFMKSTAFETIKISGILPLWFTPIYEQEEKIIRMGNSFDLKITSEGVFHKDENITKFVIEVKNWYISIIPNDNKISGYSFEIDDILLSRTGCCQNSKISEWLNVYNVYQEMCK